MVKNRVVALVYRVAGLILSLMGLLANFEVFKGKFKPGMFAYYTILSNILIIGLFVYLVVKTIIGLKRDGVHGSASYAPRFEMVCVIDIFLTFVVYWAMLVPQSFAMDGGSKLWSFSNLTVHAITPILCFIDYFIFTKPHHLKYKDVFYTLIFPAAYFVVMSIVGACGYVFKLDATGAPVHYPYFFFDYDRAGGMVAVYVMAIMAFLIGLAHLLYWIDKKWDKKRKLKADKIS